MRHYACCSKTYINTPSAGATKHNSIFDIYRIFSNLIRTRIKSALGFADFLNEKKLDSGSNPHLSFNRPLPTRQTDLIILDVTNALTFIQLTRRV